MEYFTASTSGLPEYTTADANKILKIDNTGIYVQWLQDTSELPIQTGNANKILTTNGSTASWTNTPSLDNVTANSYKASQGTATTNGYTFTGDTTGTGFFLDTSSNAIRTKYGNSSSTTLYNGLFAVSVPININAASQSATNPALLFADITAGSKSGFYGNPTDGNLNACTNNVERWKIGTTNITHNLPTYIVDLSASATTPSFKINNASSNTGIYSDASNRIQFTANGTEYFRVENTGVQVFQSTGLLVANGPIKLTGTSTATGNNESITLSVASVSNNQINLNTAGNTRIGVNNNETLVKNKLVLDNEAVASTQIVFNPSFDTGFGGNGNNYIRCLINGTIFVEFNNTGIPYSQFTQNLRQSVCPIDDLYVLNSTGTTTITNASKPFWIVENTATGTVTIDFGNNSTNGLPDGWNIEILAVNKTGGSSNLVKFNFGNDVYKFHNGSQTLTAGGGLITIDLDSRHKIFNRKGINSWYWTYS